MLRGFVYGVSAAAIWGGMYVVSDVVLQVIPPFTLLLLRLLLGAISLSIFLIGRPIPQLPRRFWMLCLLTGAVGYGMSLGAQFVGTDLSTAVNGAVVTSATPAFVVVFAVLLLREQLTFVRVLAVVLATIGVLVILDLTQIDFSSATFMGNLFLALSAVMWALYSVLVRWVNRQYLTVSALFITVMAFGGGFLLVIPASIVELSQETVMLSDLTVGVISGILFLGVVSTAIAFWLWNTAFTLLDASTVSVLFFVQPMSGAILGWLFLGQAMTFTTWVGGGLIALGVGLSIYAERQIKHRRFVRV